MQAATPYLLACLISSIPGIPPGIKFEDAYYSLLPIDKTKCPNIHPIIDIRYDVYTSTHPTAAYRIYIDDDEALLRSEIDFNLPTIIFFHAFFEDSISPTFAAILRQGFLALGGHNLIFVNAPRLLAGPWYVTAVKNTRVIGLYTAHLVDYLVSRGLDVKKLHLIGLSLGAQTAGVCGHYMKSGKPARITGLDPAGPLFKKKPANLKLDHTDADFVDVIHTDAGIFGYGAPIGHADFWPNGGKSPQPGCKLKDVIKRNPGMITEKFFCSHWRSSQFFAESIIKPHSFAAIQCNSWSEYEHQQCNSSNIVSMGYYTPPTARGNYYVQTQSESPFSLTK